MDSIQHNFGIISDLIVKVRIGLQHLSQRIIGSNTLIQGALAGILTRTPQKFFEDTVKTLQVG